MASFVSFPPELQSVQRTLADALARVEAKIGEAVASNETVVQDLVRQASKYHGKMLRPMLVVLSGMAARGAGSASDDRAGDEHVTLGAVVELIHLSTLVHDDVLDEADERRGSTTINRLAGNEAAVILGDYLFSAAYRLCGTLKDPETTVVIGRTAMALCSGELLQLHNRGNLELNDELYDRMIYLKTGSLIETACERGASAAGGAPWQVRALSVYGSHIGSAFQIQDDVLDLTGEERVVGKPLGRDAELGKLTLPVIHHLSAASAGERERTMALLAKGRGVERAALVERLKGTGSIEYAREQARSLVADAKASLRSLDDTPARRVLELMADAVVSRER